MKRLRHYFLLVALCAMPMFLFMYISCNHPKKNVTAVHAAIDRKQSEDDWLFYNRTHNDQGFQSSATLNKRYVKNLMVK